MFIEAALWSRGLKVKLFDPILGVKKVPSVFLRNMLSFTMIKVECIGLAIT